MPPAQQSVAAPATEPATTPAHPRSVPWALVAISGVAVVLTLKSLFSDWLTSDVYVRPELDEQLHRGFSYFGVLGTGFTAGLVGLIVLVGLALWLPGRIRSVLAVTGVVLAALLLADALLMLLRISELRAGAAATVVDLVRNMQAREEVPEAFGFSISSQGLYVGAAAVLTLGLVAAQLSQPRRGPWIQAGIGTVLGLVALALPWVQSWSSIEYRLRIDSMWLWSLGLEGYLLGLETLALMVLTFVTLRTPGYARARWAAGAVALSVLIFFSAIIAETRAVAELYDLGTASDVAVLDAKTTGVVGVLIAGAVLLGVAAARSYWRGREELPPAEPGGWLPGTLRDRRD